MPFASLGLSEPIVRAVTELGYTQPTPIQARAIPAVLSGGDLLANAQTGTGKTAGFTLPILQLLSTSQPARAARRPVRALVLVPTRELAAQVEESVRNYGRHVKLTSMTVFGGVNINPQISKLRAGVDILVATPGRLLDHVGQRTVDLSQVEILVLDEADRMLDMGFIPDIRKIIALLPKQRQNLLFSATFSDEIRSLADRMLDSPQTIEVARRNAPAELVDQKVILVDKHSKRPLLSKLIKDHNWYQVLVFTRTKHGANRLAEQLVRDGIPALAIHGNKSQGARTRALAEFKDGTMQVLVATDIAARGLDIVDLPHVVNFEVPNVAEDYVHRIGRTGRAGTSGEAVSLVCVDEHRFLADIERLLKRTLPRVQVEGFEPDLTIRPERIPTGGQRGQRYDDGLGESPLPRANRGGGGGARRGPSGSDSMNRGKRPPGSARPSQSAGSARPQSAGSARPAQPRAVHAASTPHSAEPNSNRGAAPRGDTPARQADPRPVASAGFRGTTRRPTARGR